MSLADALDRAAGVRAARAAIPDGDAAWIVGGAVRDALAGRDVVDVDLAVSGDPGEIARRIARGEGGAPFELSAEFGTWRVLAADRSWHVDVTKLRGETIEADLAERDFTVNAMAVALHERPGAPLDPHGGGGDLADRRLRAVSQRSFSADPLRVLRAARLVSTLGFDLDPATAGLARATAAQAGDPAGERQFAELRLLVTGPDPLRGIAALDALGATAKVLPELEALRGVEQNPNHHLDVLGHTLEVLDRLLEVEQQLDTYAGDAAPAVRRLLAEPLADELTRGGALRFGALLHDVGKPATRSVHEGGFVSFVGHDREGAVIIRQTCARLKTSRALARHLEALALHHLHLGFMTHERPVSRGRLYDYLRLTAPVAADVTLLTVADRLSARGTGPTATSEMIEAHLELVREVLPPALEWHFDGPPRAPIAGDELADRLGIAPGPRLGELLAQVEKAVFAGEVTSADDAVRVAERALDG